ncbi:meiotic RNA-binding protein 1 [Schizosaccharomyces japonicus yFS275]|uniref:Meiotic RNA-binding protein 1 n=1 Tax=Schizosaccharomyces japonicus (strain yFS275 / FY16936) TaxID=402676 RepID=B6K6E1_SCHJY|nr:meiotic RNA-binding protein 1 [Schizosaccharomyces japonicus yFS275]EEB09095.1 meiotic RNA-binding protein 1 [Schizosaccharomyces japonicus yFS275]
MTGVEVQSKDLHATQLSPAQDPFSTTEGVVLSTETSIADEDVIHDNKTENSTVILLTPQSSPDGETHRLPFSPETQLPPKPCHFPKENESSNPNVSSIVDSNTLYDNSENQTYLMPPPFLAPAVYPMAPMNIPTAYVQTGYLPAPYMNYADPQTSVLKASNVYPQTPQFYNNWAQKPMNQPFNPLNPQTMKQPYMENSLPPQCVTQLTNPTMPPMFAEMPQANQTPYPPMMNPGLLSAPYGPPSIATAAPFIPPIPGNGLQNYVIPFPVLKDPASQNNESLPKEITGYDQNQLLALALVQPAIPPAIPSMFPAGSANESKKATTVDANDRNVYIRGLPPNTSDELLLMYVQRFGLIESSKAIIDINNNTCKGYGFACFQKQEDAYLCIACMSLCGYQCSFAKESFSSRLKSLQDRDSTNLYISNLPPDWTEDDILKLLNSEKVVSVRVLRDNNNRSRGVGFARMQDRDTAEKTIEEFNGHIISQELPQLLIRFADSPEQKSFKGRTQKRRMWRAREYNVLTKNMVNKEPPMMPGYDGFSGPKGMLPNMGVYYVEPPVINVPTENYRWSNPSKNQTENSREKQETNETTNPTKSNTRKKSQPFQRNKSQNKKKQELNKVN